MNESQKDRKSAGPKQKPRSQGPFDKDNFLHLPSSKKIPYIVVQFESRRPVLCIEVSRKYACINHDCKCSRHQEHQSYATNLITATPSFKRCYPT